MGVWDCLKGGLAGFKQGYLNADTLRERESLGDFDLFSRWEARRFRYDLFWSLYQNNTFDHPLHSWAKGLKWEKGLYRHTRNILSPARVIGTFYGQHIYGGPLDGNAGDGESRKSAIPILTESEPLRAALSTLWRHSRMNALKSRVGRDGAIQGDGFIKAIDDPERGKVKLQLVHPGHMKWYDPDDDGNCRSYLIERLAYDPRHVPVDQLSPLIDPRDLMRVVIYNEEATVKDGKVIYKTYLNGAAFNWRGTTADGAELPPEWEVPYPHIPLVQIQHEDVGLPWGMGELHCLLSKVFEIEDLASGLGDQIRKAIRSPKAITGTKAADIEQPKPNDEPSGRGRDKDPDRTQMLLLAIKNPEARVHDLTFNLDLQGAGEHLDRIKQAIERDFPELQMEMEARSADSSGRALREIRKRVTTKVQERRPAYDEALVRIQQLACYIGAVRGYQGYEGLAEAGDDWATGPLAHEIAHRPVFEVDPLDDIEEDNAFWEMVNQAVQAGCPLEIVLERQGWTEEEIDELMQAKDANAQKQMDQQAQMAGIKAGTATTVKFTPPNPGTGDDTAEKAPDYPEDHAKP